MTKEESKFNKGEQVTIESRRMEAEVKDLWYNEKQETWIYALKADPNGKTHVYTEKSLS